LHISKQRTYSRDEPGINPLPSAEVEAVVPAVLCKSDLFIRNVPHHTLPPFSHQEFDYSLFASTKQNKKYL